MSDSRKSQRPIDVLVYGATGFTGKLVAQELAQRLDLRIALAGRTKAKVDALVAKCLKGSRCKSITAYAVDVSDEAAMQRMCADATIVIACAGPFSLVGMPVVDACVASGTHYVDITGEFTFVRRVVERHHATAAGAGVFVIPCGGFDCVASDITNHYTHRLAAQSLSQHQDQSGDAKKVAVRAVEAAFSVKGATSRGTMESVANLLRTVKKEDLHPLCLVPRDRRRGRLLPPREAADVSYHPQFAKYRGPFIMAAVNERIVRRSDFLAGRDVAYTEMTLGSWRQAQTARAMMATLLLSRSNMGLSMLRRFVFPPEGGGPSEASREAGGFGVRTLAYTTPKGSFANGAKPVAAAVVSYNRDPYAFTAVAAVEVALAVRGGETTPGVTGGVLTPSTAVGDALLARLKSRGLKLRSKM